MNLMFYSSYKFAWFSTQGFMNRPRIFIISESYLLRVFSVSIRLDLIRSWYGLDTELV